MANKVRTEKEFAEAIKRGDDTIEIEGSLADKTIRLRATGNVAWAVAIGAVGIAFYSAVTMKNTLPGEMAEVRYFKGTAAVSGIAAVSVLGAEVTFTAIALAVAAGSVGVLSKIRGYREIVSEKGRVVLQRR